MGTSYTALLYVGKQFDDQHEAEEFIRDTIGFTDEEERAIEENGLSGLLYGDNRFNLDGDILNYYTDWGGFVLGTQLSVRNPETFMMQVEDAFSKWNALFPDTPAAVVHTVRVS